MVTKAEQKETRKKRLQDLHVIMLQGQEHKGTTLALEEIGALAGRPGKASKSSVLSDVLGLVSQGLVEVLDVPTRKYKAVVHEPE